MKATILAIVFLSLCSGISLAWVDSVTTDPPTPNAGVPFTLKVDGYCGEDSCWLLVNHSFFALDQQEIVVELYYYDCISRECSACNFAPTPFNVESSYDIQQAGTYTIRVVEYRDSAVRYTDTTESTFEIVVAGSTPIETRSWSTIKCLYR